MKDVLAWKNLIFFLISLPFSIGLAWATMKAKAKNLEKQVEENKNRIAVTNSKLDSLIDRYEVSERDKIDRLGRIESKLDLLITGKKLV
jgi:hypothetical protein